jgi:hypothetical protein
MSDDSKDEAPGCLSVLVKIFVIGICLLVMVFGTCLLLLSR